MWGKQMVRLLMLFTLALLPLGCCTKSACTLNELRKREKVEVPVATQWKANPVVQVCDTAPVTKDEVEMVLAEWARHGAPKLKVVSSKSFRRYCGLA